MASVFPMVRRSDVQSLASHRQWLLGGHAKPVHLPQRHPLYINPKLEQRWQVFKDTIFILLQARGIHSICHLLTDMVAFLHNALVTVLL